MIKYIKILREWLKKLPKGVLIWIIIVLGFLAYFFARTWYTDYSTQQVKADSLQYLMLKTLDSVVVIMYQNTQRSTQNEEVNVQLLDAVRGVQSHQIQLDMKVNALVDALPELEESFEQIDQLNEQYQELRKESNNTLPPISRSNVVVLESPSTNIVVTDNDEDTGLLRKIGSFFKRIIE